MRVMCVCVVLNYYFLNIDSLNRPRLRAVRESSKSRVITIYGVKTQQERAHKKKIEQKMA